jgi:DnaJ-domain-containing protein 1
MAGQSEIYLVVSQIEPIRCSICGALNPPQGWFCKRCHLNLAKPPAGASTRHYSVAGLHAGPPPLHRTLPPHIRAALHTLGIDDFAGRALIQKSYRRLMKQYHPDRLGGDCAERQLLESRAKEINAAYKTLRSFYAA